MFAIAILIGIYSYCIFALGLLGLLYLVVIFVFSIFFLVLAVLYFRKNILEVFGGIREIREAVRRDMLSRVLLLFFAALVVVNLVGALGPELAFDALWYHLTLPKLYLLNHAVVFIPGGLLYYSAMPKLTEMLYTAAFAIQGETLAKTIHFLFGVLSVIALYKLARLFLPITFSLLASAIFYSNLVVGWESITAYVDLARTFFEILALLGIILWIRQNDRKWLVESAVMLGLAVTTKLLAIGSLLPLCLIIIWHCFKRNKPVKTTVSSVLLYCFIVFLIPLPWFVFSFIHTGNPVYPFFTSAYDSSFDFKLLWPNIFVQELWMLFTKSADPISPLYIMAVPLIAAFYKKFETKQKLIIFYTFSGLLLWYFTPRTGGGRFIIPYLPAFSLVVSFAIKKLTTAKFHYKKVSVSIGNLLVVSVLLSSLVYRGVANSKYIPVLLGMQTKTEFLKKHLNFSFGDFYDIDGYFNKTVKSKDKVLLYGFHNLYYADFPFIDSSFVQKGNTFNYIAIQNGELPERFRYWSLIYYNPITNVRLYTLNKQWIY